jgi:hypothetical protein
VNMMFLRHLSVVTVLAAASLSNVAFAGDEDDVLGYDAIISELNREANPAPVLKTKHKQVDPFENIWIHAGVGLATQMQTIDFADGTSAYLNQKGMQFVFGIDLFSENLAAEGSARSLSDSSNSTAHSSLKEFELKVFYKERFSKQMGFRIGAGLTARYLTLQKTGEMPVDYTTPSSVGSIGLDLFATDRLSLGADVNARGPLIAETLDRGSYDATFRVDMHF